MTQTNRQVPLVFALPVTRFEVDVGDLAARATRMALARLTGVEASDRVEWVQPMLADRMTTGEEHRIDPDQKRSDGSQPWIERDARKLAPSS